MKNPFAILCLAVLFGTADFAHAVLTSSFDKPIATGSSQAFERYYTDRYDPAGFENAVLDGENVLKVTISSNDQASSRPASFSSGFYNTQGRKFDLNRFELGADILEADLYLNPAWQTLTQDFRVGMWGTGVDGSGATNSFPILSFGNITTSSDPYTFRVWDGIVGDWVELNTSFDSGTTWSSDGVWVNLRIELDTDNDLFRYFIDDTELLSLGASGTAAISNVILQANNSYEIEDGDPEESYEVYWDNVVIPEPTSASLLLGALGLLALRRRRP